MMLSCAASLRVLQCVEPSVVRYAEKGRVGIKRDHGREIPALKDLVGGTRVEPVVPAVRNGSGASTNQRRLYRLPGSAARSDSSRFNPRLSPCSLATAMNASIAALIGAPCRHTTPIASGGGASASGTATSC